MAIAFSEACLLTEAFNKAIRQSAWHGSAFDGTAIETIFNEDGLKHAGRIDKINQVSFRDGAAKGAPALPHGNILPHETLAELRN